MNKSLVELFKGYDFKTTIEKEEFEIDLNEIKEFLNIYDDEDDTL
ncbi:hypothetical protein ACQPVP_09095 [Clostridium nigeriense]